MYVDLPEQQVADGIVFLQVSETKVGRVRVVGAKHYSPLTIRDEVPALQEGEVPNFNRAQAELTNLNRGASRAGWCRWSRKAACRAPWTWT